MEIIIKLAKFLLKMDLQDNIFHFLVRYQKQNQNSILWNKQNILSIYQNYF